MAFSLIANTGAGGAPTGVTTSGIDTTGADLIVLVGADYASGSGVFSDSKSNTWTVLTLSGINFSVRSRIAYAAAPSVGSGHTFSLGGANSFPSLMALAFSGGAASPFDQENGATASGAATINTGSVTPSEDSELLVAGVSFGALATMSIGSSFTITDQVDYLVNQHFGGAAAYKIQTTAGAENPQWSRSSGTSNLAARIATFKIAAGGGGGGNPQVRRFGLTKHVANLSPKGHEGVYIMKDGIYRRKAA